MYKRFKWEPEIRITDEYPGMIFMPFFDYPKRIFVCSTFELFHLSVKKEWRDWIFDVIEYNDRHTFQILTKLPQNIDRPMPDNVWLGVSVTKEEDKYKIVYLDEARAEVKFVSFEPLLGHIKLREAWIEFSALDWVIIGRLTGYGHKYDPYPYQIRNITTQARMYGVPIFLKDNLKEIWRTPLIQEFPKIEDE